MKIQVNLPYHNIPAEVILSAIEAELFRLKIRDIERSENRLSFKKPFFHWEAERNLMVPIDKGCFKVELDSQRLTYIYSTIRMMLITLAMSLFLGLVSQMPVVGMIAFMWLFGANWVIALISHHLFVRRLIKKVIPNYNNAITAN